MENSDFKRILIVGSLTEHRKAIAAAVIRCTQDARVAGCDVAKQAYPGPRFDWAVYDVLIVDATEIAPAARAWLAKIMALVKLPPIVVVNWHANVNESGDFYRLGVCDYLAFDNPNIQRMRIALGHAADWTARQSPPSDITAQEPAPVKIVTQDTPVPASIEQTEKATAPAESKQPTPATPPDPAPEADEQSESEEQQAETDSKDAAEALKPDQILQRANSLIAEAETSNEKKPVAAAVAAANDAIGPDLDDVDEDDEYEDEESSGFEDLSQMSRSLADDDESSSGLQDPSFVTSGLMSILDRGPGVSTQTEEDAAPAEDESSSGLQDPSFVTSGLMSILDRGPDDGSANRSEEDSSSLQDPSFVTSGLLSILDDNKASTPPKSSDHSDHMEASFVTSGLMSILDKPEQKKKVSSGFGYGWPFTPEEIEKGEAWLGDYQIIEFLALGGSSSIFKTKHRDDDQIRVLKLFKHDCSDDSCKERFHRGYELISSVSHQNIAKIYGPGEYQDWLYIVMEYFPKSDLKSRLRHPIKPERAIKYALQIAAGLSAAHQQKIIHRALKPSDILFREDDSLALADFGISKAMISGEKELTKEGVIIGKPDYISPEQAEARPLDARSDLYSLGIILYEMIEGRRPFIGASTIDTMRAHLSTPMPPMSKAQGCLAGIVKKLLEKNPDDRYQNGRELIDALKDCRD